MEGEVLSCGVCWEITVTAMGRIEEKVNKAVSTADAAAANAGANNLTVPDATVGISQEEIQKFKTQVTEIGAKAEAAFNLASEQASDSTKSKQLATKEFEKLSKEVKCLSGQVHSDEGDLIAGRQAITGLESDMRLYKDRIGIVEAKMDEFVTGRFSKVVSKPDK